MSTQYLQFSAAPSQTCTPKLFGLGGDAVLFTGSAVADSPSGSGLYKSAFSEASALNGTYRCVVFVGSVGVAGYEVKFTGTDTEVAQGAEFINASGGDTAAQIYEYFTDGTREEVFRADVTAIQNATDQFRFTVSNQVDANALTGGYPSGPGGIPTEIDIQSDGVPLDGAAVWISTDTAGAHVIAGTLYTNAQGKVTFMLEAGDYYVWVQHSSVNFNNPSALTVTG